MDDELICDGCGDTGCKLTPVDGNYYCSECFESGEFTTEDDEWDDEEDNY